MRQYIHGQYDQNALKSIIQIDSECFNCPFVSQLYSSINVQMLCNLIVIRQHTKGISNFSSILVFHSKYVSKYFISIMAIKVSQI